MKKLHSAGHRVWKTRVSSSLRGKGWQGLVLFGLILGGLMVMGTGSFSCPVRAASVELAGHHDDSSIRPFTVTTQLDSTSLARAQQVNQLLAISPAGLPQGDTNLGGSLLSTTTLLASRSPYTVSSNLTVPSGMTLIIEPGVTVQLRKGCGITIFGQLLAGGSADRPITLTRYPGDLNWERLMFVKSSNSVLRHCLVQYANCAGDHKTYYATNCAYPMNVGPRHYFEAVVGLASHLEIEACIFTNLFDAAGRQPEGDAIGLFSDDIEYRGPASANILGCQFRGIGQGITTRYAYVLVENCYFVGKSGDNDDVDLYGESSLYGLPNPEVRNNLFDVPASDDRINPTRCSVLISGNVLLGSTDHAIVLRDTCNPIVYNNLFYASNSNYRFPSGGIAIQNGCDALIVNNTFMGINSAIKLFDHQSRISYPYCLSALSGRATVINCLIWNGSRAIDVSGSAGAPFQEFIVKASASDIQGGTNSLYAGSNSRYRVEWGSGIINANPLFVNSAEGDFHLSASSPCIDAGATPGLVITTNTLFVETTRLLYAVTNDLTAIVTNDFDNLPRPLDGQASGTARFDIGTYEFLRTDADSNKDGIPDGWSWQHGLNPALPGVAAADPDQDQMNNLQEYVADTDPANSFSWLHLDIVSRESAATASFLSSTNRRYTLFAATNLMDGAWTAVPGQIAVPGNGGTMSLKDTNAVPLRYYRVGVQLP